MLSSRERESTFNELRHETIDLCDDDEDNDDDNDVDIDDEMKMVECGEEMLKVYPSTTDLTKKNIHESPQKRHPRRPLPISVSKTKRVMVNPSVTPSPRNEFKTSSEIDDPVEESTSASSTGVVTGNNNNRNTHNKRRKRVRPIPTVAKRRSRRGNSSISLLAETIVSNKNVVFITGAGLSVKSGIRPFRGNDGLWAEVVWRCVVMIL